jgi:hypothetical protein
MNPASQQRKGNTMNAKRLSKVRVEAGGAGGVVTSKAKDALHLRTAHGVDGHR